MYFTAVSNFAVSEVLFNLTTSERDADLPEFTLAFNVSVVPPTYVTCQVDSTPVNVTDLSREVTARLYITDEDPTDEDPTDPVTSVTVTLRTREAGNYQCNVSVFRASGDNLTKATLPISISGRITLAQSINL